MALFHHHNNSLVSVVGHNDQRDDYPNPKTINKLCKTILDSPKCRSDRGKIAALSVERHTGVVATDLNSCVHTRKEILFLRYPLCGRLAFELVFQEPTSAHVPLYASDTTIVPIQGPLEEDPASSKALFVTMLGLEHRTFPEDDMSYCPTTSSSINATLLAKMGKQAWFSINSHAKVIIDIPKAIFEHSMTASYHNRDLFLASATCLGAFDMFSIPPATTTLLRPSCMTIIATLQKAKCLPYMRAQALASHLFS
ncbi:hypothetical protein VNO77_15439 [Canavalia gladiata]|uniref:Uncharacterized protein n=1 Tax=Canavalia gladiata TaxID=3824 RepID=A0AAN9LZ23_CANGL